ncbi:MAG: hypothetical protein J0I12_33805 [Candidatus Eremiobacteraeota bacterium]|nr:hypothetical protein [Candidatus Eremiobacteraeota bacterium]
MRRRGSITLTCLGCFGLLLALVIWGLLKGLGKSSSVRVPEPDPRLEFSVRSGDTLLEVSRPRSMVRLVRGDLSAVYSLKLDATVRPGMPPGPGWLIRQKSQSFVTVDPARLHRVGRA